MPRVTFPAFPLSALFAVAKPTGPTSMSVVDDVKHLITSSRLFMAPEKLEKQKGMKGKTVKRGRRAKDGVKIGQGGTLDPLADGVLVIGVGKGTKQLSGFLDCVKEYRATCLLGCETDSYDSEGTRVRTAPWRHVTRETVENALDKFRGEIEQTPPIFSALKMDGRPLYEYARKGIPLPRPIEKRKVTVHELEIIDWKGNNHDFRWPDKAFSDEEKQAMERALRGVEEGVVVRNEPDAEEEVKELEEQTDAPTAFVLKMKVSGGTYVRSIVHDLSHSIGSAGHVVTLTRSRQGRFTLEPEDGNGENRGCVPWMVFKKALEDVGEPDEEGWTQWERAVMDKLEVVEEGKHAN